MSTFQSRHQCMIVAGARTYPQNFNVGTKQVLITWSPCPPSSYFYVVADSVSYILLSIITGQL